jgi:cell division septum initiation protein DivIVA
MADPLDSNSIARRSFEVARRGYEQQEVRAFLHEVSSLFDRLHRESAQLRERAERAEARMGLSEKPDETMLLEILGEETTRVLTSARDAAAEIRTKAELAAERIIGDATSEAAEARADAVRETDRRLADAAAASEEVLAAARSELERRSAEAEEASARIRELAASEGQALRDEGQRELERAQEEAAAALEAARNQGREMVAEAQAVRERVLRDLAVRRKKARQQVEKLNAGRERLLQAYDVVRRTIDEATDELGTSLSDARMAADAAARRIDEEPEATMEQLDEEVANAAIVDLPIIELDHDDEDAPGPFSGEVPVVDPDAASPVEERPADDPTVPEPPVDLEERRGRKGRRKKETFEGIDTDSLPRVEPPAEGEGVTILAEPAEPESEAPTPDAEAPDAEGSPHQDEEAEPAAAVDDLFARLRAEREGASEGPPADAEVEPDVEPVTAEVAPEVAPEVEGEGRVADEAAEAEPAATEVDQPAPEEPATDEPATEEPEAPPPEPTPFTERDAALEPIDKELSRRLKRALADEQNQVLDLLRRAKPQGVDDLLPDPDTHAGQWADVASPALTDAASAGASTVDGSAATVDDLAEELARSLTAPLRERIDRTFAASDGNLDDVADRVRALYREWKGKRLAETSRHYVAAAYAHGLFDGLGPDAEVRWVLDPTGGPCPDCDDNVLGGTMSKGAEFPTGHQCAPAHPGCRCLVLAADH